MKKKIGIIIGVVICAILVFTGGYYFANKNMSSKGVSNNKSASDKVVTQQSPKEDDKIDGFDLGVLTKDEFHKAEKVGREYKGKKITVEGVNTIVNSNDIFQQTYGSIFSIETPYVLAIDCAKSVAEQYLEVNDTNVINNVKNGNNDFNTFNCMTIVGGDDMDFLKNLHMVLRVYGENETKELQPRKTYTSDDSKLADTSQFFPNNPSYQGNFGALFDAKDIVNLKPTKLEIIVVYPDGKEAKQSFNYNQLNQL